VDLLLRYALFPFSACSFIVDGDINNQPLLRRMFEIAGFTHVLHLSCPGEI